MNSVIQPLLDALRSRLAAEEALASLDIPSVALPSVRLVTKRVPDDRIGVGESRIGGIPDVPAEFEWPRWMPPRQRLGLLARWRKPAVPTPLGFIAQIDLSSIPSVDDSLPSSGWLYFFYDRGREPWGFDPADRGCSRVVHVKCDRSALATADPPSDLDPKHIAKPCRVDAVAELTLPGDWPILEYGTPADEAYEALYDDLMKDGPGRHRLLGHAQVIQDSMELECQLASNGIYCGGPKGYQSAKAKVLAEGAADWRLLLQIDSDRDGPGWMWVDAGRIYFWIKREDLYAQRFDDAWLILQGF